MVRSQARSRLHTIGYRRVATRRRRLFTTRPCQYRAGMGEDYALALSPEELERYALMAGMARRTEQDLWDAAGLVAGASVADVGCGPGAMFPAVMSSIGPSGQLVGIDGTATTVAAAQSMIDANGWTNASVQVGRADGTGLEPGTFDAVMMRHVLAHNGPIEQDIVTHLATLVRPGGHVFLVDIDYSAFRIRPA